MRIILFTFLLFSTGARELDFSFLAKTNMPGVSVEGKSLKGIRLQNTKKGNVEIDLNNLSTEMELRDEHMREEVFKGQNINISFQEIDNCENSNPCKVKVDIEINKISSSRELVFSKEGSDLKSKTVLNLEEFKITPPSKFGVRVLPEIEVVINVKN